MKHKSSLLAIVNFYRTLFKKGIITEGSAGYQRMKQLELRLELSRDSIRGRRIVL